MSKSGDKLPVGFLGPVRGWNSLLPSAERILRLPRDLGGLGALRPAADAAPAALCYDLIEVQALTESMGRVEDVLAALAPRLAADGRLVLEVENPQSQRQLRLVVEGRAGSFEPLGSSDDPTLPVPLRRVLAAVSGAGLHVDDLLRVTPPVAEFGAEFAAAVSQAGLLPLSHLHGPPPDRFWLVLRHGRPLAGTALIGPGSPAQQECTEISLRAFLPPNWQVQRTPELRECAAWNRGIAAAEGELLWFLRAGAVPTEKLFVELQTQALVQPALPGTGGERRCPGDLSGSMVARSDVLLVGPVAETIANTSIALEDWCMRMDALLPPATLVDGEFASPPPPVEQPSVFAAESAALLQRWSVLDRCRIGVPADVATEAATPPWAGRSPRISLCMIARNEQRFLRECLERARAAVDEIVVVDTGSTDDTVAIAESFGARVLHEAWDDDFSAPRNTSLAAATGDWILVLDADEFLTEGAAGRIRELALDPVAAGYHLHFVNDYGNGQTLGVMMVRLFRNLPGVHYQNVIHEQVTPSLVGIGAQHGLILKCADVQVVHHGYSDAVMTSRAKNERNERLFQKQLALTPDDIYTLYKYGDFLRRVPGRGGDAAAMLERCLERIVQGPPDLPRALPYAGEVAALCALEAARAGQSQRAREMVDTALRRFLPTPNLHYIAASLALYSGRNQDAILHYRQCLRYRGQVLVVPIQEGITGHVSLTGIAQAWLQQGDIARARTLLEQVIAGTPGYEVAHLALSKLHLQQGDPVAALQVLTRFLARHPRSAGACQQTTLILHRLGQRAAAQRMGRHAVALLQEGALDHEAEAMEQFLAALPAAATP